MYISRGEKTNNSKISQTNKRLMLPTTNLTKNIIKPKITFEKITPNFSPTHPNTNQITFLINNIKTTKKI